MECDKPYLIDDGQSQRKTEGQDQRHQGDFTILTLPPQPPPAEPEAEEPKPDTDKESLPLPSKTESLRKKLEENGSVMMFIYLISTILTLIGGLLCIYYESTIQINPPKLCSDFYYCDQENDNKKSTKRILGQIGYALLGICILSVIFSLFGKLIVCAAKKDKLNVLSTVGILMAIIDFLLVIGIVISAIIRFQFIQILFAIPVVAPHIRTLLVLEEFVSRSTSDRNSLTYPNVNKGANGLFAMHSTTTIITDLEEVQVQVPTQEVGHSQGGQDQQQQQLNRDEYSVKPQSSKDVLFSILCCLCL